MMTDGLIFNFHFHILPIFKNTFTKNEFGHNLGKSSCSFILKNDQDLLVDKLVLSGIIALLYNFFTTLSSIISCDMNGQK